MALAFFVKELHNIPPGTFAGLGSGTRLGAGVPGADFRTRSADRSR
jgi:hypothetical protein